MPSNHAPMRDESFKTFLMDQLSELPNVVARPMFGGYGLYQRQTFFGIVFKSRLYFKTDDAGAAVYRARGMKPFRASVTQVLKTYYEVPADVLEDADALATWARCAIAAQRGRPSRTSRADAAR